MEFSIKRFYGRIIASIAADVRTGARRAVAARARDGHRDPWLDLPQGGGTDADRPRWSLRGHPFGRLSRGRPGRTRGVGARDRHAKEWSGTTIAGTTICCGDWAPAARAAWTSGSIRLDPAANWEPFATLSRCFEQRERAMYAFVLDSAAPAPPVGTTLWIAGGPAPPAGLPEQLTTWLAAPARGALGAATSGIVEFDSPRLRLFLASTAIPRELLLIGGGPDALPVVEFGADAGLARDRGGPSAGLRRHGAISAGTTGVAVHSGGVWRNTWISRGSMPPWS